jgi:predicted RNase H-like nuclease (RuvC/YqgF family)
LSGARKGETRAGKLDQDLAQLREETEKKANTILGLEQKVKELKAENKLLTAEVDNAKKEASLEKERESNDLKRERDDMLADLETKLRTSEREAAVREDALRHEVGELRKRWQDAVRRADELSIDVQQSSAPLMRQLESTERQHRARAAAWAELEMKLRSDLEENIVQTEKLTKERTELTTSLSRMKRAGAEKDEELAQLRSAIDEANGTTSELRNSINQLEAQNNELQHRCQDVEAEAHETVTKIRSEITDTLLMSEERYQSQIASLERKFKEEKDLAVALEAKLEDLAKSSSAMPLSNGSGAVTGIVKEAKQKKLQSATGQADILSSALAGFDDGDESDDNISDAIAEDDDSFGGAPNSAAGPGSFAAMEQLSQGLKGAKLELQALRKQLATSEETRESLVADLADARAASEKLPLFEAKVAELTEQVRMKDLEIQGLTEDLQDVKNLYRSQLDMLLEAAAEEKKGEEASVPVIKTAEEEDAAPVAEREEKEENGWAEIADPSVLLL